MTSDGHVVRDSQGRVWERVETDGNLGSVIGYSEVAEKNATYKQTSAFEARHDYWAHRLINYNYYF